MQLQAACRGSTELEPQNRRAHRCTSGRVPLRGCQLARMPRRPRLHFQLLQLRAPSSCAFTQLLPGAGQPAAQQLRKECAQDGLYVVKCRVINVLLRRPQNKSSVVNNSRWVPNQGPLSLHNHLSFRSFLEPPGGGVEAFTWSCILCSLCLLWFVFQPKLALAETYRVGS